MRLIQNWVDGGRRSRPGEVVLLENCRCNKGEKKDNEDLAKRWPPCATSTSWNDAFGTAHRAEATTHGIARFAPVACAGGLMGAEIDASARPCTNRKRPLVAIVGGSKVSSKLTILKSLADKVDQLIVGGGIANTFLLASGKRIGESLAEADLVKEAHAIMDIMKARGAEVPLPTDVVVADEVSALARANKISADDVAAHDRILDIGPKSAARLGADHRQRRHHRLERPGRRVQLPPSSPAAPRCSSAIAHPSLSIAGGGDTWRPSQVRHR